MSDERFARQYRYEPPPEFPLASPCTRIVHHLSGPSKYTFAPTTLQWRAGVAWLNHSHLCRLRCVQRVFHTPTLAYLLDSLVRVSRRVGQNRRIADVLKLLEDESPPRRNFRYPSPMYNVRIATSVNNKQRKATYCPSP